MNRKLSAHVYTCDSLAKLLMRTQLEMFGIKILMKSSTISFRSLKTFVSALSCQYIWAWLPAPKLLDVKYMSTKMCVYMKSAILWSGIHELHPFHSLGKIFYASLRIHWYAEVVIAEYKYCTMLTAWAYLKGVRTIRSDCEILAWDFESLLRLSKNVCHH